MKPATSIQHVLRHALTTLPDSLTARKELLFSVRALAEKDSEERFQANLLIEQITAHERTQLSFQFEPLGIPTEILAKAFPRKP